MDMSLKDGGCKTGIIISNLLAVAGMELDREDTKQYVVHAQPLKGDLTNERRKEKRNAIKNNKVYVH